MTKIQDTKINKVAQGYKKSLFGIIFGPWKIRSISLITLLSGYYLSSNFISYFINSNYDRVFILILALFLLETLIRIRSSNFLRTKYTFLILIIDNFRLGFTYAVVLEAFKLGS